MVNLLQVAPCGIFSFNDEGMIVQVSPTLCEWVHYRPEELQHKKLDKLLTLSSLIFYQTHFLPLLKMQYHAEEIFLTLKTKEGSEIPMLVSAQQVADEDQTEYVCACIPIYHRKQYEDEILQAKREAENALQENSILINAKSQLQHNLEELDDKIFKLQQRNEELHQFHSIISHDLQEPLRKLHLFADLLHLHKSDASGEVLHKVTQQVNRVRGLFLGLQEYVQLDNKTLKLSPLELNAVVLMAKQKLLQYYPAANLELELSNLPRVEGDLNQLVMLFYHLLENSFKFRSAAPLRVNVEGILLHQNQFKGLKDQYQYTHHVKILYNDNGIGFDPKHKEQIFQLLKKVDQETEGQGVGLTICKKIVTNHKGTIEATGEEGRGACFTIFLPLRQALVLQGEKASLPVFG